MHPFYLVVAGVGLVGCSRALSMPQQQPMQDNAGPIHTMDGWGWKDCGLDTYPIRIESIRIAPDPPQPGQDMTVTVKGNVVEEIAEGAYADVSVKLGLVKIMQKQFDVCEEARSANASVQCPVEEGTYTVGQTVALPKEIPKAKITIAVDGYTVDDNDMLCLKLEVNFMKRPFPRLW